MHKSVRRCKPCGLWCLVTRLFHTSLFALGSSLLQLEIALLVVVDRELSQEGTRDPSCGLRKKWGRILTAIRKGEMVLEAVAGGALSVRQN